MKRFFSNGSLSGWLTKRQIRWWIVLLGCLLGASCVVGRHFGLLTSLLLAVGSISIAGAVIAYLNWNRGKGRCAILWEKNAPQITRTWNYRPKETNRREAASESEKGQAAGIAGSRSSGRTRNDDVWFDFISPQSTAEHAPWIARSSGDAGKISTYDQSPIDNGSVAPE
jgi:hypothetical protein